MAQAQTGNTVRIHYTGKLEDGTVFQSSDGGDPLEFELGKQHVHAGDGLFDPRQHLLLAQNSSRWLSGPSCPTTSSPPSANSC